MTDERAKKAMESACRQLAHMCSLPKTQNTPRQQRILDGLMGLNKYKDEKRFGKGLLAAQWEYLKTMFTDEDLEEMLEAEKQAE